MCFASGRRVGPLENSPATHRWVSGRRPFEAETSPRRGSNTPAQGRAKRRQPRSAALGHRDHENQALKGRHNDFQGMYFRGATVRERWPKSGWFVRAQAKHSLTVVPLIIASFDCSEQVLFRPFRALFRSDPVFPGRRCAADAAALCPGLICSGPFGANSTAARSGRVLFRPYSSRRCPTGTFADQPIAVL